MKIAFAVIERARCGESVSAKYKSHSSFTNISSFETYRIRRVHVNSLYIISSRFTSIVVELQVIELKCSSRVRHWNVVGDLEMSVGALL